MKKLHGRDKQRVIPDSDEPEEVNLGDALHIVASAERAVERVRSLKHGDTFAVFDHYGDIRPAPSGEEGLYYDGTRFLSSLSVEIDGARPMLLGSTVRDDNDQLTVTLTNPDVFLGTKLYRSANALHMTRKIFLYDAVCYQQIRLENYAFDPVDTALTVRFSADYMDIYEVRGMSRRGRGLDLIPDVEADKVGLHYEGLDGELRSTLIRFTPVPTALSESSAEFRISLRPHEKQAIVITIACRRAFRSEPPSLEIEEARSRVQAEIEQQKATSCSLQSLNGQFNAWVDRALSDLHMMITPLSTGPYPYAGVPWFNTPFGRDGIITAWECLWMWPAVAKGVLGYLAATQATEVIPEQDAEPGKILHETRNGEMAALREMPFGRYYGSVDATPLFVALAGAYYERTADIKFIESIWPNLSAALQWMSSYGDKDRDGFIEYERSSVDGLIHQGWKDADDAIFHTDGTYAQGAIALCEVQGYAYGAYRSAAKLAGVLGGDTQASHFVTQAELLRERFNEAFWCEELSTYALALDGEKRRCGVVTSNAGQCLFTGIANSEYAKRVAQTLLSDESFSGWGIRTAASSASRFNPMSYHNGSVWPHDNALIAYGMKKYGLSHQVNRVFKGLFEAALHFDLHRMPELFCGFAQESGEGPILYPVACAPQAWSATAVFLLFQACLGIEVDGLKGQVRLWRPVLPEFLSEVRIKNLCVGGGSLDLLVRRHGEDVSVTIESNGNDIPVVLMK
jgi:glycogen debranching enzyme